MMSIVGDTEYGKDSYPTYIWLQLIDDFMRFYDVAILEKPGPGVQYRRNVLSSLRLAFQIFKNHTKQNDDVIHLLQIIKNGNKISDMEIIETVEKYMDEIQQRKLIKMID